MGFCDNPVVMIFFVVSRVWDLNSISPSPTIYSSKLKKKKKKKRFTGFRDGGLIWSFF